MLFLHLSGPSLVTPELPTSPRGIQDFTQEPYSSAEKDLSEPDPSPLFHERQLDFSYLLEESLHTNQPGELVPVPSAPPLPPDMAEGGGVVLSAAEREWSLSEQAGPRGGWCHGPGPQH